MIDKKALKKQYKQSVPPMGIYQIKNLLNGKVLIGSSRNLTGKINSIRFQLKLGSCMNKELQKDYDQLGEEKFSFDVLDYLKPKEDPDYDYSEDLKVLQNMWMEKFKPLDGGKMYS
jgi:hypothetical protein